MAECNASGRAIDLILFLPALVMAGLAVLPTPAFARRPATCPVADATVLTLDGE